MTFVFLVSGAAGEWDDRVEWNVAAFRDRKDADALCAALNQWCIDHRCHTTTDVLWARCPDPCPLDPKFSTDTGGTLYQIEEIELR